MNLAHRLVDMVAGGHLTSLRVIDYGTAPHGAPQGTRYLVRVQVADGSTVEGTGMSVDDAATKCVQNLRESTAAFAKAVDDAQGALDDARAAQAAIQVVIDAAGAP